MKVTEANKTKMEEVKVKKANYIQTPSAVSVNMASGNTANNSQHIYATDKGTYSYAKQY